MRLNLNLIRRLSNLIPAYIVPNPLNLEIIKAFLPGHNSTPDDAFIALLNREIRLHPQYMEIEYGPVEAIPMAMLGERGETEADADSSEGRNWAEEEKLGDSYAAFREMTDDSQDTQFAAGIDKGSPPSSRSTLRSHTSDSSSHTIGLPIHNHSPLTSTAQNMSADSDLTAYRQHQQAIDLDQLQEALTTVIRDLHRGLDEGLGEMMKAIEKVRQQRQHDEKTSAEVIKETTVVCDGERKIRTGAV